MNHKTCKKCNQLKPIERFYRSSNSGDGFQYECRDCYQKRCFKKRQEFKRLGLMNHSQRTQRRLKVTVLVAYGGKRPKCACCGESMIEFLSIDHINGDGNNHRRSIRRKGTGFYHWLRRNRFPKGFRVLCHNCNQAIGFMGYCPHKRKSPFCPPPRMRMIQSEIRLRISKALKKLHRPTIGTVSRVAKIHYETAQRYRQEFINSGQWLPPRRASLHI